MMSLPRTSPLTAGKVLSASMTAFTKNDMKPSLMPCDLTNRSW
jgi:hypothetical protein